VSPVFGLGLALTVAAMMAAFHPGAAPLRHPAPRARSEQARATRAYARRRSSRRPAGGAVWTRRELTVWLPYWSMPTAYGSAMAHSAVVRTASPFWYTIAGDSTIEPYPGAGESSIIDGLHSRGMQVVPTVTESDGMRAFDRTLASARRRAALVQALMRIVASRDYDGLDLDFEEFAVDHAHAGAPADAAAAGYAPFVAQVCGALHASARSCSVTVMPRTGPAHVYWRGKLATWVYDYAALAKVADRVQIMAYDEHASGTAAGPVAPYPWVEQVIHYAASTMPVGKADLALAAYGYDFGRGGATSMTAQQAAQLADQRGATLRWDPAQAEETFAYGRGGGRHTVWYENGLADYDRARLAAAAGFAGVDLWAAGGEDTRVWPLLGRLIASR
jgi:spore germination protein YaaH